MDPRLDLGPGLTGHSVPSLVGQVGHGLHEAVAGGVLVEVPHRLGVSTVLSHTYGESTSAS